MNRETISLELGRGGRVAEVEQYWEKARDVSPYLHALQTHIISSSSSSSSSSGSTSSPAREEKPTDELPSYVGLNQAECLNLFRKVLTDNAIHLPSLDLARYQKWLLTFTSTESSSSSSSSSSLSSSSSASSISTSTQPRVAFSFRSRQKSAATSTPSPSPSPSASFIPSASASPFPGTDLPIIRSEKLDSEEREGEKRYEEVIDRKLVIEEGEVEQGTRIMLREVKGSQVYICGIIAQLRIKGAKDSLIATGPVTGSVYVEECQNCTIITANQQLRIHNSSDCQLYVTTKSPAVILEDCSRFAFAPYLRWLPRDALLFQQCQFEDILHPASNWDQVRDFNWLKAGHSPNWSVLPPSQRLLSLSSFP